jgi:polysaccharide biosynthesis protein PslH
MKKVLFISPVFPDLNGAGREKRAYQWVMKLQQEYEVHLLVIRPEGQDKPITEQDIRSTMVIPRRKTNKLASLLEFGWVPLTRADKEELKRHYGHARFDTILCFRLYLQDYALFLASLTRCGSVELDMDDLESSTHLKIAHLLRKHGHVRRAVTSYLAALLFRRKESRIGAEYRRVYLCSDEDKASLGRRLPGADIGVMPNRMAGVPGNLPLPDDPYQLLFIGSLDYYPNEEAVTWFIKKVLSALRRKDSRWMLHVVGFTSRPGFKDFLSRADGVLYHGRVEKLDALYSGAYQIISPLHAGGGTKLKILEAMWYGRPIIATHESVYGLGLTPFKHYLPAEDAEQFAAACERLAGDVELARTLIGHAREILLEKYHF